MLSPRGCHGFVSEDGVVVTNTELGLTTATREATSFRLPIRGVREATTLLWVYVVYSGLRNFVTGSPDVAARHAAQLLQVEHALDIGVGQPVRVATEHVAWLTSFANVVYASHAVVPVVVLCVLYRTMPERYRRWRDTFVIALGIGLIGFWLYPVMPPWILARAYHFVDTTRTLRVGHSPLPGAMVPNPNRLDVFGFSNPYASMPSLHVAWALMASIAAWPLLRRRWLQVAGVLYPVLMLGAVTVTWNHWTLDSIGGVLTVAVAYVLAGVFERAVRAVDRAVPAMRRAAFRS